MLDSPRVQANTNSSNRDKLIDRCWWLDACYVVPQEAPCVVQLGRYGDLLQLMPAFRLMGHRDGIKPVVMVSHEYASVFDGISYAFPWVVPLEWWKDSAKAKQQAMTRYRNVIVPQYWNDLSEPVTQRSENGKVHFIAHGRKWAVEGENADYGTAMWNRLGFTRQQMLSEPLVLDRRSPEREAELVRLYTRPGKKTLLYNFTGVCSPFGYVPEMMRVLLPYRTMMNLVDLGKIRARRIYDLLGLYDVAVGLITIDTATAHLANASQVPALWFTVDSTGESIPRANVALHVKYSQTPKRLEEIDSLIRKWYEHPIAG